MIFPVLFYHEGANIAQNAFIDAIEESNHTDRKWPGVACELENIGDCVFKPAQFGIDIFPAYVFVRRRESNPEEGIMVKKMEGRELTKEEILAEIADADAAEFQDGGGAMVDLDGDGVSDVVSLPKSDIGLLGLGMPVNGLFECNKFFPAWVCRVKVGYVVLLLMLVFVLIAIIKRS